MGVNPADFALMSWSFPLYLSWGMFAKIQEDTIFDLKDLKKANAYLSIYLTKNIIIKVIFFLTARACGSDRVNGSS